MSHRILTDEDVRAHVTVADIIEAMASALREHARGTLIAPPRFSVDAERGSLVFTAGAATDRGALGFRVYETFPEQSDDHTQLVAVYDSDTGAFRGLVVGHAVGVLRTGAIGGVAIDYLAHPGATTLGVLGTGPQARMQARAAAAVRDVEQVNAYSPTREHRETFAERMTDDLGIPTSAVDSPERAVTDADILVCATTSESPVFEADWLKPGVHVNTLGPKFANAHELPLGVVDRSAAVVTDSLAQVEDYAEYRAPFFLDADQRERMVELGDVVVGDVSGRRDEDVTLFCSVGLAGTEVVLADEVLRRVERTSG